MLQRSEELLEEVVLSRTLNYLRGNEDNVQNVCTTFIETKEYVFTLEFYHPHYILCNQLQDFHSSSFCYLIPLQFEGVPRLL